jgi:hypothetical protein
MKGHLGVLSDLDVRFRSCRQVLLIAGLCREAFYPKGTVSMLIFRWSVVVEEPEGGVSSPSLLDRQSVGVLLFKPGVSNPGESEFRGSIQGLIIHNDNPQPSETALEHF